MNKHFRTFSALLILATLMVACTAPTIEGGTPPSSSDQVATVVVMTLQALTPEVENGQTPEPEAPADTLLPHTFYFLGTDNAGLTQVFRIERDGKTQKQLTFEPESVKEFDVSLADGSVARSEEHTSELQSLAYLVCRLLLEKKKKKKKTK